MNYLRVKVLAYYNADDLEDAANTWLRENPNIEVRYMKHSISVVPGQDLPGLLSLVIGYIGEVNESKAKK